MVDAGTSEHHAMPHRHLPLGRRQVIAQVVVGAVILVSGIAIGGGGTILALKDRIVPKFTPPDDSGGAPSPDGKDPGRPSSWIADKWKTDYGLDDKQTQQAKETLAKEFATTEKLRQEFRKSELAQREKFVLAVKGIMTPEQFAKWEPDFRRMVEHMESTRPFDPRRGGRGGPRPDWRPDRPRDPNDKRGDWRSGPPRDPNRPREEWQRDGFKGPGGRRGDWGRDRPRDPNGPRGPRPPEPFVGPNDPPADLGRPQ